MSSKDTSDSSAKKAPHHRTSSFATSNLEVVGKEKRSMGVKKNGKRPAKSKINTGIGTKEISTKKEKSKFDKDATKKFNEMIDGNLSNLPPQPKTMVKIFLSSTFSDMREERNILAREVYPYLRAYCSGLGLDFQVVDMRWGITDDSINDHSVEKLCLLEVANCQKTSIGPNFIVLSGQRYGFRPIPVEMMVNQFEMLQNIADQLKLNKRELLSEWYKLDENRVPPMYILQPIKSKFTFFGDYSPGCDDLRQKDSAEWWKTLEAIQGVIRRAAKSAFDEQKITADELHQYFLSVTECEIQDGILNAEDVADHCLVYIRELVQLDQDGINETDAHRHIDVIKTATESGESINAVDKEVEQLRNSLREKKMKKCLPASNIKEYAVHWLPRGVDPKNGEHSHYLKTFCADFIEDCMKLIEKAETEKEALIDTRNFYTYYDETIHHLKFCQSKCESFCGQEEVLSAAKAYILNKSGRKPLVIHAESGLGKTSIMAMIMKSIPKWLGNQSHIKIIRFLGTTPMTNDIFDVMYGILGQLSDAYKQIMPPYLYSSMKKIVECTPGYIRQIANQAKEPVIILLDSIDQLYQHNNAYAMEWMPLMLPTNVKLIVSSLPNEHGILNNLKKLLPDPACYVEVPALNESTAKLIVETYLKGCNRTLQPFQKQVLLSVFSQTQSPLFLKLLLDEAKMWNSYTNKKELELPRTVKAVINKLFEKLENKFGYALVSHALGYITIGLNGLTEFEIEDVLSCDDDVLNEVYKYHDPPVPGIVRIPLVLWARIRYDIQNYLVERMSQGKHTLYWYHRQFIETARERYTDSGKDVLLHKNLATIYMQENGVKCSITLKNRKNMLVENADRQVTPQPFKANNKRKLACLPFHTLGGYKFIGLDKAKSAVYCNFKFLCTRIAGFSASVLINDLNDFVEESKDEEVKILLNFLTGNKSDISQQTYFAFCLLAYINPGTEHRHLNELQIQAREFLISEKKPMCIPEYAFLAPRTDISSACQTTLQGFSNIVCSSSSSLLLRRQSDKDSEVSSKSEDATSGTDYGIWSSDSFEVTDIDVPDITRPLVHCLLGNENLLYIHKHSLVDYNFINKKSRKLDLSSIQNLDLSEGVVKFVANADRNVAFVSVSNTIAHIDVLDWNVVDTFTITEKPSVIENVLVIEQGDQCVAVGKVIHSSKEDQQQGPENQSFLTIFKAGNESSTKFWASDKKFNSEHITLACKDQWLCVGTLADSGGPVSDEVKGKAVEEPSGCQLIIYNLADVNYGVKVIEIASSIAQLHGHPYQTRMIVRTQDGCVYCVHDIDSSKPQMEKINVEFAVTNMTVAWGKEIAFFSSLSGSVVLYNLEACSRISTFTAHPANIQDLCMLDQHFITLGANIEMKVWSVNALLQDSTSEKKTVDVKEELLDQLDVIAVACTEDSDKILTCHDCGVVKVWKLKMQEYIGSYNIQIAANVIHVISDTVVAFHDTTRGMMMILDIDTGKEVIKIPPSITNILHSTMNSERDSIYLLSASKKGKEQVDVISMKLQKISKTIHLKSGLTYEDLTIFLSGNERYLVIRHKISEKEYEQIKAMWKKGGFSTQDHRYRFTAVDLSQGSGALIPCNRQLSKIPTLGLGAQAYRGNTILVAARRYIMLWDIPTGRCDSMPSKGLKVGMFYRPEYCGMNCVGGNTHFLQSLDQTFVVTGSEDGYLMVYNADTGIPRGGVKPATKHNSGVQAIAISPDNQWVVSTSQNYILKLWDSLTGTEQFSVRLDARIQSLTFSPNSDYVVFYTGTTTTRVGIFSVPAGK